ncbi:hypothetical protein EVAR_53759_1, partial [Eumeta japonica]
EPFFHHTQKLKARKSNSRLLAPLSSSTSRRFCRAVVLHADVHLLCTAGRTIQSV